MLQNFGQEISSYSRDSIGPLHTPYQAQFAGVPNGFLPSRSSMGDFATTGNASR